MTCAWAPATTRSAGAPCRPSASTFQPASASTAWRAAARQVTCAIWQPVTKPTPQSAGRPSSSRTQPAATASATVSAGAAIAPPPFWSQAEVSQSAATAAGSAPPITKPK